MRAIDLNADLGEECGDDAGLLAIVTSANIAAGGHAGGGDVMHRTVRLAARMGVAVGAHPSYPDRESFGRAPMMLSGSVLASSVAAQVLDVARACESAGVPLTHVKAHGSLYNEAMSVTAVAEAFMDGVGRASSRIGCSLPVVGLPGSALAGLAGDGYVAEGFVDRAYGPDGRLVARANEGALLDSTEQMIEQAVSIVVDGRVRAIDGSIVPVDVETICLHGDTPDAVTHAVAVRAALEERGVSVAPW